MSIKIIINSGLFKTGTSSLINIYILIPLVSTAYEPFCFTLFTSLDMTNKTYRPVS